MKKKMRRVLAMGMVALLAVAQAPYAALAREVEEAGLAEEEAEAPAEEARIYGDLSDKEYAFAGESGIRIPGWNQYDENGAPIANTAEDMVIAVIDSGVNYEHSDLDDVMWRDGLLYPELVAMGGGEMGINYSPGRPDGTAYDMADPMDDRYHGTHVAGIIAAEWNNEGVSGGVSGAKIMAVKALSGNGSGTTAHVVKCLKYVLAAKRAGVPVAVVNISWGGASDQGELLNSVVTELGEAGVITVFAAGNHTSMIDGTWQAANFMSTNPYALVVAATDENGQLTDFSDYGVMSVHVAAPGKMILSTYMEEVKYETFQPIMEFETEPVEKTEQELLNEELFPDYAYLNGTSMATPVVSAAVAILKSAFPEESADRITARLIGSCRPVEELKDQVMSGGIVDVERALAGEVNPVMRTVRVAGEAVSSGLDGTLAEVDAFDNDLDGAFAKGSVYTVNGHFFGDSEGSLLLNGEVAQILSWSDTEIVAQLNKPYKGGPVLAEMVSAEGRTSSRLLDVMDETMLPLPADLAAFRGLDPMCLCAGEDSLYLSGLVVDDSFVPALWRYYFDTQEWENLSDRLADLPAYSQINAVAMLDDKLALFTNSEIYLMAPDGMPELAFSGLTGYGTVKACGHDGKLWFSKQNYMDISLYCADPATGEITPATTLPVEVRGILLPEGVVCPDEYTSVIVGRRDYEGFWMERRHSSIKGSPEVDRKWIAMGSLISLVAAPGKECVYCFGTSTTLPGNYFLKRLPIEW